MTFKISIITPKEKSQSLVIYLLNARTAQIFVFGPDFHRRLTIEICLTYIISRSSRKRQYCGFGIGRNSITHIHRRTAGRF